MAASARLPNGSQIGKYRVMRLSAERGIGRVYEASDDGKRVWIAMLASLEADKIEAFENSARLAKALWVGKSEDGFAWAAIQNHLTAIQLIDPNPKKARVPTMVGVAPPAAEKTPAPCAPQPSPPRPGVKPAPTKPPLPIAKPAPAPAPAPEPEPLSLGAEDLVSDSVPPPRIEPKNEPSKTEPEIYVSVSPPAAQASDPAGGGNSEGGAATEKRPACANGYGNSLDVNEGLNAADATCGCGCTTTQPSCTTGNLTILAGSNGMTCNNQANQMNPANTSCTATNPNFATNNGGILVTGPAPSGGSCAANGTKMVPGVTFAHNGRTCDYTGMTGGGCMNGNVCAADPKPFATCIAQKGMQACPMGWPVQHLVGSMVTDTRDCTACTCQFNAGTCTGTATFYSDGQCQNNATNVAVDGACHAVASRTYRGYKYAPTTNASCTGSNSAPSGKAAFGDLQTVCCTN